MKENFSTRLTKALNIRNMKPIELSEKSGIPKSAISQYLSGQYKKKKKNLDILSEVLNVNQAWLMGHDVPMERNSFRFASSNGIDVEGLDEEDIKEINEFVKFIKSKKKNTKEG